MGIIVHTGDFKVDYTPVDGEMIDLARFAALGEAGVLLMLADSTNIEYPGFTISEKQVGQNINEMFEGGEGQGDNRHLFVQHTQGAADNPLGGAARQKVCFMGRSMIKYSNLASEINELKYKPDTVIESKDIKRYRDRELVIITTGSQGEEMSGLVRMATSKHGPDRDSPRGHGDNFGKPHTRKRAVCL